ncbi:D-alanine--D-alanine ligase [Candidatus Microgenomates bacterium]|nr:D-alanine--D-alanine ligase [Candidatus Microgenomates bacterium]
MKKSVAVIFGGRSAEHDISIITGQLPIMQALRAADGYEVVPIYISKAGDWYSHPAFKDIRTFQKSDLEDFLQNLPKLRLLFDQGLFFVWPGLREKRQSIDVVFPAMHGTYGEDGSLMGLLRMANIPFVGCDLEASVIAMDKVLLKQVAQSAGLPSVKYEWFGINDWQKDQAAVLQKLRGLKLPVFVKPVHLGSSIAISKVGKWEDLANALEVALHYDDKVIVEESLEDLIEVTVPIMGDGNEVHVAMVERPLKGGFFNFDEKYMHGGKKKGGGSANAGYSELPAKLPARLYKQIEDMTKTTFRVLGGSGLARVDFLIDAKTGQPYVNEVNTLPGSLYNHNWKTAGISDVELVNKLISFAEARHARQQRLTFTFKSNFLQQF